MYEQIDLSEDLPISHKLEENIALIKGIFHDCSDLVFRELTLHGELRGVVVYLDGMVNSEMLSDNALYPLLYQYRKEEDTELPFPSILNHGQALSQVSEIQLVKELVEQILSANAVLLIHRMNRGISLNVRGGTRRGVDEPNTESVIRGPREGFTESLRTNTSLVRFRIKTPELKMVPFVVGRKTKTNLCLAFLEGIADPEVIEEVKKRIEAIDVDAILESGYIEELIEDDPFSPFPQMQYSERPDAVSGHLLEGRFAIFVDGTPFVITGPVTAPHMMQATEDYYERYVIVNLIRWLRYVFLFLSLLLPAVYIAVITYHQDMLPTSLLYSIAASREAIPFPAFIEALIMEISFEALREAGIRLPKTVGQAVSILGALVIGQAAVQAGIVSAPMVIVVSLTGIASFTIPRFNFGISTRILRFPLMVLATIFGLYGIIIGMMWIVTHLCAMRSFGVPYMSGIAPFNWSEMKDIFIRAPWWKMNRRPESIARKDNLKRQKEGLMPQPPPMEEGNS